MYQNNLPANWCRCVATTSVSIIELVRPDEAAAKIIFRKLTFFFEKRINPKTPCSQGVEVPFGNILALTFKGLRCSIIHNILANMTLSHPFKKKNLYIWGSDLADEPIVGFVLLQLLLIFPCVLHLAPPTFQFRVINTKSWWIKFCDKWIFQMLKIET